MDAGDLEGVEGDDLVAVVDIKATDDRLFLTALPDDDFYMGVLACQRL